jgi:hypothetical protein
MMDPEIKARWVEALRSGAFKQATGTLRSKDGYSHCCLGVLCEVADLPIAGDGGSVSGDEDGGGYGPINELVGGIFVAQYLYGLNDADGKTFPEIADYIEANL